MRKLMQCDSMQNHAMHKKEMLQSVSNRELDRKIFRPYI
jgi:hypothetical protein